jgi:hypothetical protein
MWCGWKSSFPHRKISAGQLSEEGSCSIGTLKKIRLELSEEGSCSIGASQHAYEPKDEVLVSVHFRH